jgi:hypothetical protein
MAYCFLLEGLQFHLIVERVPIAFLAQLYRLRFLIYKQCLPYLIDEQMVKLAREKCLINSHLYRLPIVY